MSEPRKLSMEDLNRLSPEAFRQAEKLPVVAVLENVRSAYNVGSLFRTSDAFLLHSLYLCGYTAFPPHKEIRKTALGAEETVTWKHFRQITEAINDLRAHGFRILAVEQAEGSTLLQHLPLTKQPTAFIFGNEVTGVEQSTIALCDGTIEIPQLGMKHSLNIATAAGIVLWQAIQPHLRP